MKTLITIVALAFFFNVFTYSCDDNRNPPKDDPPPHDTIKIETIKSLSRPQFKLFGITSGPHPTLNNTQLRAIAEAFYLIHSWKYTDKISYMKGINPDMKFLTYMNSTYVWNVLDNYDTEGEVVESNHKDAIAMTPVAWINSPLTESQTTFQVYRAYPNGNKRLITDEIAILASTVSGHFSATDQSGNQKYVFWIRIGDELMKVVNFNKSTGEITVTRGFNNTVPSSHFADSYVFCPIYIGSQSGSALFAPGSTANQGLRYALDPQITGGNILRAVRAMEIMNTGMDGIWLDIFPPSFFNMADIYKRSVKPWDFTRDTFYLRDDWRYYQEIKAVYLHDYIFERTGKVPVIAGNNMNPDHYFEGEGGSRLFLMPTEIKPIPLYGMCNEGIFGRTGNDWKEAMKMFLDAAKYDLAIMPIMGDAGNNGQYDEWPDTPERDRKERYGYATFLLAVEKDSKMLMGTYPFYKDAGNNPFLKIHKQYYWYVGTPMETLNYSNLDNFRFPGTGVYKREFSNAIIMVNPGTVSQLVNLQGDYLDPDTGRWKSTIEIPAAGGKIMLKRNILQE